MLGHWATDSDLQGGHRSHGEGGALGRIAALLGRRGMSPADGASSRLRAATDLSARGGASVSRR